MKVIYRKAISRVWREGTYYPDLGTFLDKITGKRVLKKDVLCYVEADNPVYLKVRRDLKSVESYAEELQKIKDFKPLNITPEEVETSSNDLILLAKLKNRKTEIKLIRWYLISSMICNGHKVQRVSRLFRQHHSTASFACKSVLEFYTGPDKIARAEFERVCEKVIKSLEKD